MKQELQICNLEDEIAELSSLKASEEDPDFVASVESELVALQAKVAELKKKLQDTDPNDEKNALVEIQAGVGGDEAALFAADLFRMYENYAGSLGLKVEPLDDSPGNMGGFKFITFMIQGENAYGTFKNESGVHRVQRVPKTETKGRVHTSTVAVIVLPEEEVETIDINKNEVTIEHFCSGGPGGQHQNKTQSAVRLTHIPTGVSVTSRTKSSHANLKFCWKMIASKIREMQLEKASSKTANDKKQLRGTASRSEKIRTYNFPQDRVTDHRIRMKYSLQGILSGKLDQLFSDVKSNIGKELEGCADDDD